MRLDLIGEHIQGFDAARLLMLDGLLCHLDKSCPPSLQNGDRFLEIPPEALLVAADRLNLKGPPERREHCCGLVFYGFCDGEFEVLGRTSVGDTT